MNEIHPSSIQPVKGLINQGLIVEGRLNRWYKSFWDSVKKTSRRKCGLVSILKIHDAAECSWNESTKTYVKVGTKQPDQL